MQEPGPPSTAASVAGAESGSSSSSSSSDGEAPADEKDRKKKAKLKKEKKKKKKEKKAVRDAKKASKKLAAEKKASKNATTQASAVMVSLDDVLGARFTPEVQTQTSKVALAKAQSTKALATKIKDAYVNVTKGGALPKEAYGGGAMYVTMTIAIAMAIAMI